MKKVFIVILMLTGINTSSTHPLPFPLAWYKKCYANNRITTLSVTLAGTGLFCYGLHKLYTRMRDKEIHAAVQQACNGSNDSLGNLTLHAFRAQSTQRIDRIFSIMSSYRLDIKKIINEKLPGKKYTLLNLVSHEMDAPKLMKKLLDYGANPNEANEAGATLLHDSFEKLDVKRAELLVKYGAQRNALNNFQQTPLDLISLRGQSLKTMYKYGLSNGFLHNNPHSDLIEDQPKNFLTQEAYQQFLKISKKGDLV